MAEEYHRLAPGPVSATRIVQCNYYDSVNDTHREKLLLSSIREFIEISIQYKNLLK